VHASAQARPQCSFVYLVIIDVVTINQSLMSLADVTSLTYETIAMMHTKKGFGGNSYV